MDVPVRMTGVLEPRGGWRAERCTIARSVEVLSTRSMFLLVREAFYGATRFEQFVNRTGLSEPVAASRLRELVDHGILEREPYQQPGERTRQGYGLTPKGQDLFPVLVALMQWGNRWIDEDGGPVELRHRDCGSEVTAELRCSAGHPVAPGQLDLGVRPTEPPEERPNPDAQSGSAR